MYLENREPQRKKDNDITKAMIKKPDIEKTTTPLNPI